MISPDFIRLFIRQFSRILTTDYLSETVKMANVAPFVVGGGGGAGGSQSPACRTPFSHLPYLFVPLSPDSRLLLCFSRYQVNHAI